MNEKMILDAVQKVGTPAYIYDGNFIIDNFSRLKKVLPGDLDLFYSLKSNPNISIVGLLNKVGAKAEVCSMAELHTAINAGVKANNIIFLGPGKTKEELKKCIEIGIAAIVCESIEEINLVNLLSREKNVKTDILIRINPSFSVKGTKLTMAGKPRQFGIDEKDLISFKNILDTLDSITILGFHIYLGTRILSEDVICENTKRILELSNKLAKLINIQLRVVDIGGGLGVPYFEGEKPLNIERLGKDISVILNEFKESNPNTQIIMELGRYLVAESGVLVSQVLYKKESMGKKFLITNAGTNVHMAAVGIGSFIKRNFPIHGIKRSYSEGGKEKYHITGPLCTPNDTLGTDVELDELNPNDLIVLSNSGAYGPTASPTSFLSHGFPSEVLIINGESYLIREKDTTEDLLRKQNLVNFNNLNITLEKGEILI